MNTPPRILIVDDNETNRDILATRLGVHGYELHQAADGEEAIAAVLATIPDLILLDIMMPGIDGIEVCRRLKNNPNLPFIPIILVTAKADSKDVVVGLESGADEYLTKPIDPTALVARVKSVLRVKELYDRVEAQAKELAEWTLALERRVTTQVAEIERINRLRQFLSPTIAEAIVSSGDDKLLESHRRDIAVLFCDLRGFTAFAESVEPEELMQVLREYHAILGDLINKYEGTVERFTGDGLMVWFNDPVPCPDPCVRAVRMAIDMRASLDALLGRWHKLGYDLGFGVGIAHGYATLGRIGFRHRFDYAAVGSVVNLAARLCGQADTGEILVDGRVNAEIEGIADVTPAGELTLKGFHRPARAFKVNSLKA